MEIPFKGRHRKEDYLLLARVRRKPETRSGRMDNFDPDKLWMVMGSVMILVSLPSVQSGIFFLALGIWTFGWAFVRYRRRLAHWETGDLWQQEYHGVITEDEIFSKTR
jgi:hypothetical protein